MKAFIVSLCVFALLLGGILWNTLFIRKTTREMNDLLNKMEANPSENTLAELENLWEKSRARVSFSSPLSEIDAVSDRLTLLRNAFDRRDSEKILLSISLIRNAVDNLVRSERPSLETVFKTANPAVSTAGLLVCA